MKLVCYPVTNEPPTIRPAEVTRGWMDETPQKFAYRCLPLNIANAQGWEILSPVDCSAYWTGAPGPEGVVVLSGDPRYLLPTGHFGHGVLTFPIPALFRTEPGYDLHVGGPVNAPRDGIAPLTAIVETDWSPYTFTMNWRFTRPAHVVSFRKGEPICHFFPVARATAEALRPEFRDLDSDPELAARYRTWTESRRQFNADLHAQEGAAVAQGWQRSYFHGLSPDGQPAPEHRTRVRLCPFSQTDGE